MQHGDLYAAGTHLEVEENHCPDATQLVFGAPGEPGGFVHGWIIVGRF